MTKFTYLKNPKTGAVASIPYTVAVDFDGTLVEDCYPKIGAPKKALISLLNALRMSGVKVILWTCRTGEELEKAVGFCAEHGLTFDAVNTNLPVVKNLYGHDTRKVFADVYLDDKGTADIDGFMSKMLHLMFDDEE